MNDGFVKQDETYYFRINRGCTRTGQVNTVADGLRHKFDGIEIYNQASEVTIGKGYGTYHYTWKRENG